MLPEPEGNREGRDDGDDHGAAKAPTEAPARNIRAGDAHPDDVVLERLVDIIMEMEEGLPTDPGVRLDATDRAKISDRTAHGYDMGIGGGKEDAGPVIIPLLLTTAAVAFVLHLLFGQRRSKSGRGWSFGVGEGRPLLTEEERRKRRDRAANLAEGRSLAPLHPSIAQSKIEKKRRVTSRKGARGEMSSMETKIPLPPKPNVVELSQIKQDGTQAAALQHQTSAREKRSDVGGPAGHIPERRMRKEKALPLPSAKLPPSKPPPSKLAPPAQIVCEALSSVCRLDVQVAAAYSLPTQDPDDERKDNGGSSTDVERNHGSRSSWIGSGWKKRPSKRLRCRMDESQDQSTKVTINLLRFAPPSKISHRSGGADVGGDSVQDSVSNVANSHETNGDREDNQREEDWSDLRCALCSLLNSTSPEENPFRAHLLQGRSHSHQAGRSSWKKRGKATPMLRSAAEWHSRSRSFPRDTGELADLDRSGLAACLSELEAFVVREAVEELRWQVQQEGLSNHILAVEDSIFEGGYNTLGDTVEDQGVERWGWGGEDDLIDLDPWRNVGDGPVKELLRLLELGPPSISGHFIRDCASAYDGRDDVKNGCEEPMGLADIFVTLLFWTPGQEESSAPEAESLVRRRLSAISHAVSISTEVSGAIARRLGKEARIVAVKAESDEGLRNSDKQIRSGRQFEECSILRGVLRLAGHAVPEAGMESAAPPPGLVRAAGGEATAARAPGSAANHRLLRALDAIPEYPLCIYDRRRVAPPTNMERRMMFRRGAPDGRTSDTSVYDASRGLNEVSKVVDATRDLMKAARTTVVLVLRRAMAAEKKDKQKGCGVERRKMTSNVIKWINALVQANEELIYLLETDLLSPNSIQASCSTQSFLMGAASSLLLMCSRSLAEKFDKETSRGEGGVEAFDARYLRGSNLATSQKECRLVASSVTDNGLGSVVKQERFAGATELFFLIGALLRPSLFHILRVRDELHNQHRSIFSALERAASTLQPGGRYPPGALAAALPNQLRRTAGADLAFTATLDDPQLVGGATEFALLQLRWLADAADGKGCDVISTLGSIPEWMCKLPSQWFAHIASSPLPHSIEPFQGEQAVQCATRLLRAGSTGSRTELVFDPSKKNRGSIRLTLSPPVLTQLMRIAGAFVRSGVSRARKRYLLRQHQRRLPATEVGEASIEDDEIIIDERDLDIYATFDANDLGITVFASRFVATELCPTLMEAFIAMNAVEGVDVEREHHFHKNQVQSEICELILRLWSHPVGDCRLSVVQLDSAFLSRFFSAVTAEFGMALDEGLHKAVDVRNLLGGDTGTSLLAREQSYYDFLAEAFSGSLAGARRLLLLLTCLSGEDSIASVLGGDAVASSQAAAVFVHFIDLFTAEDGGTNPDLDFRRSRVPTSVLAEHFTTMLPQEREENITDLLHAREFIRREFGLDCSIMAHWLLSLATRWHLAARDDGQGRQTSAFMDAVSSNEDSNVVQIRNILERLVVANEDKEMAVTSPDAIFERDGHVKARLAGNSNLRRGLGLGLSRRYAAKQDQMTHQKLNQFASADDISSFVDDLEEVVTRAKYTHPSNEVTANATEMEHAVFGVGNENHLTDEDYSEQLRGWVVSSESFLSPSGDGSYAHSYDSLARRGDSKMGQGKIMFKEARKCHKNIPEPHPNSSIFVCFDEERMDICRAVIVGAVDTPYALGIFEFDIFFPSNYPSVSPLVTFKTTGGGTVRFSANLYTDGKVCISILGTTQAWNESQRWNPTSSSLVQVLMSLQTQVLGVSDPFFGEGFGHESQADSRVGQEGAKRYHSGLRLATLRHAIIGQIKNPSVGMEEVVQQHFSMCRRRVLVQARRWMLESKGSALFPRFRRAYEELVILLSSKKFSGKCEKAGEDDNSSENDNSSGELLPNLDDVKALATLDPAFVSDYCLLSSNTENSEGRSLAPDHPSSALNSPSHNPWANFSDSAQNRVHSTGATDASSNLAADPDNELYD